MKKKAVFYGAATALITPFKDGKIDYTRLQNIIEMQIKGGIPALVVGGTTGESATLTDEERYALFEFAKEKVAGRVKLIFGTGTNDTALTLKHTKAAERIGCDGVLVVTPYYNKGTEEGLIRHYEKIAQATYLPIILYNVPTRTGVNISLSALERLCRHENIVAIKEASDSADRLVEVAAFGEELMLYAGADSQTYTALSLGGGGVISVISNLYPRLSALICERFFSGDKEESLRLQLKALPLIRAMFCETNPAPIKYAMHRLGLCENELRLPLSEVSEKSARLIDGEIKKAEDFFR